ncbi:MAG: 3-oxoacyl-[acyl-carrier-protein] synthase III C-terminal domain-containing protein [Bacteriovorax sp.]|jgi:alkylresorcinol/alkylpyrone synthase
MSFIAKAVTNFPEHMATQSAVKNMLINMWPHKREFIEQFTNSTTVETRYLSLPLNYYRDLNDMGIRNVIWKAEARRLQKENIQKLLDDTGIDIADIGLIASATTTGLTVPSLEALMMNEFPFSPYTKRLPLFGLGCLAGVAGINRVNDYLIGHPKMAAILMITELCSLTFRLEDESISNLVGTTLFGDGSGAVLMVGADHPLSERSQFEILSSESLFYPETERLMGWDMIDNGFQLVLSNDIPTLVRDHVGNNINDFLTRNSVSRSDIDFYIAHPGGPKVLDALSQTLGLDRSKLSLSWQSLAQYGNVSAASVINVLERTIQKNDILHGRAGLMTAMGPAFSLEMSLVRKC